MGIQEKGNYPAPENNSDLIWHNRGVREMLENQSWQVPLIHPFTQKEIIATLHPSTLYHLSPFSGDNLDIQLLPVESLTRHEAFLTEGLKEVSFLKNGIAGWNDAPMVGARAPNGKVIILDGSTRLTRAQVLTQAIEYSHRKSQYPPVFPVQIVDYYHKDLRLSTWENHHSIEDKLTKEEVLEMVINNILAKAKLTRFGVRTDNNHVFSFAETQPVIEIPIKPILGFDPPNNHYWTWLLA